jgi:serine/threonine protein kinase
MATVWRARHLTLETDVAVKLLEPEVLESRPNALKRFELEAQAAARIHSPHVVQIFDSGVTPDGRPFIVMELLEGESLEDRLARHRRLALDECVRIVEQIGRALFKAHALGIVHRDLKPANIFLCDGDDDVHVKLLDFGIAKHPREGSLGLTTPGALLGTPAYMSREQLLSSGDVDHRADLWALAVVAYEMITGEPAFDAPSLGKLIGVIHEGAFAPPSTHRAECGSGIDAWFRRALALDINERFSCAKAMARAFHQAVTRNLPPCAAHEEAALDARASSPDSAQRSHEGVVAPEGEPHPQAPEGSGEDSSAERPTPPFAAVGVVLWAAMLLLLLAAQLAALGHLELSQL